MRISHGRSGRPFDSAARALEVAVGLEERLLGQVLGVVVVADAVVGVAVDVAQVRPVELAERAVELELRGDLVHARTYPRLTSRRPPAGQASAERRAHARHPTRRRSTRPSTRSASAARGGARRPRRAVEAAHEQRKRCRAPRPSPPSSAADLGRGARRRRAARRRGGCGCAARSRWPRGRRRRRGRRNVAGCAPAAGQAVELGEDAHAGGAGGVHPARPWRRRRRAWRRSWRSPRARRRRRRACARRRGRRARGRRRAGRRSRRLGGEHHRRARRDGLAACAGPPSAPIARAFTRSPT